MSFDQAVRSVVNQYATFTGRASRSEFWYWELFVILVSLALSIGAQMIGSLSMLSNLFGLAVLVPGLAVSVRRMHDIGKSGWNVLWGLIPILGWVYVIYLAIQPSQPGTNAYGPQPQGAAA